jgi:isoleucyl-tRNA synthetase
VLPDLKRLGPKLGKRLPELRKALAAADAAKLLAELETQGSVTFALADGPLVLDREDMQIRLQAKEGWAAAHSASAVVVLSTELTPELVAEGWARELVHAIQNRRKELGCEYTDRIAVGIVTETEALRQATVQNADYIRGETLAVELGSKPVAGADPVELNLSGMTVSLTVAKRPGEAGQGTTKQASPESAQ